MPGQPHTIRRIAENPWFWRAATLAWCGVIFWGSSLPGSEVPGRFGPFGHFGEYAILAGLVMAAVKPLPIIRRAVIALIFVAVFAVTDEYHQSFVPSRDPDPVDWIVDIAGAVAGVSAYSVVAKRFRRSHPPQ